MKIRYGQLHRAWKWQVKEWGPQWQEEGGMITLRKIRFLSNSQGRMREGRVELNFMGSLRKRKRPRISIE